MRPLFLSPLVLILAACDGGGDKDTAANNQAMEEQAAAMQNRPAPTTPQLNVQSATREENWIEPRPNTGDPTSAPYANVLSEPVVKAPSKTR